jgi:hypothetical protein
VIQVTFGDKKGDDLEIDRTGLIVPPSLKLGSIKII